MERIKLLAERKTKVEGDNKRKTDKEGRGKRCNVKEVKGGESVRTWLTAERKRKEEKEKVVAVKRQKGGRKNDLYMAESLLILEEKS